MVDVATIAKEAFDSVSQAITDAIHPAVCAGNQCRAVYANEKPHGWFPFPSLSSSADYEQIWLEGLSVAPVAGDLLVIKSNKYAVVDAVDVVLSGGFYGVYAVRLSLFNTAMTIESYAETINEIGERVKAWAVTSTETGFLYPLSGAERYQFNATIESMGYRFICQTDVEYSGKQRALINGKTYNITNVINHGFTVFELDSGSM